MLVALSPGKLTFENGLPARVFWSTLYQTVMEGMFSDPIYGGNRDKAGWIMIGFPARSRSIARTSINSATRNFPAEPLGIADMS